MKREEEDQRRWLAYERAQAERDKLAEELARVYPPIAAQLADLAARIDANDQEVERINERALPNGAKRLAVAELVARGLRGFREDGLHTVPRITQLRLPAFKYSGHAPFTWPRR